MTFSQAAAAREAVLRQCVTHYTGPSPVPCTNCAGWYGELITLAERAYAAGLVDRNDPDDYERGYATGHAAGVAEERARLVAKSLIVCHDATSEHAYGIPCSLCQRDLMIRVALRDGPTP